MMRRNCLLLLGWTALLSAGEKATTVTPKDPRTVVMTDGRIETVPVAQGQTTLLEMPPGELPYKVIGGGKEWTIGDTSAKKESSRPDRYLPVVPNVKNISTVLVIISNTKREYPFRLVEISGKETQYDSEILIDPSGSGRKDTPFAEVKWIPADEAQGYQLRAEKAEAHEKEAVEKAGADAAKQIEQFRSEYPYKLRHHYSFDPKIAQNLGVTAIWSDDKFTFVEASPQEVPALYELKDGEPSQINYTFKNGLYITPKILKSGYLAIGKKKDYKLTFELKEKRP